jgi:hypothetical protein
MRRYLLPLVLALVLVPSAAHASVLATVSGDTLTVTGDGADDRITVRPDGPTAVRVNDAAFSRATFAKVAIRSGAGADEIRVDGALGVPATIESGAGADVIAGGPDAEVISAGDDADLVAAGAGADTVLLGAGDDVALEDDGTVDGQSGVDTVRTQGTGEAEEFTVQAVAAHVRLTRDTQPGRTDLVGVEVVGVDAAGGPDLVDVGNLAGTDVVRVDADLGLLDGAGDSVFAQGTDGVDGIGASILGDAARVTGLSSEVRVANADADRLTVQGLGGDDKLAAVGAIGALIGLTLEGGDGADELNGGTAGETLRGGPGSDRARGNLGADTIELGDGDDVVTYRLGDGADKLAGDAGLDRLAVPGTAADEVVDIRAAGVGQAEVAGVETVQPAPGTGADTVQVGDLTGSAIHTVAVDLGGLDSRLDTVAVSGTAGPDKIRVAANGTGHIVTGLSADVTVDTIDPGQKIVVDAGGGDDEVDASTMTKDKTQPFLFGGPGKDVVIGSPGQDVVAGGLGVDVLLLGGGLDTATWAAGDGNDIVEGGAGTDFLQLDGSSAADTIVVSPLGGRTRVSRNAEVVDLGGLERLDILPAGGADTLRVEDMSGTATTHVSFLLTSARGSIVRDGSADSILLNGSNGADAISVTTGGPFVRTTGLAAEVSMGYGESTLDRLHIDTRLGNDFVTVSPSVFGQLQFSSV